MSVVITSLLAGSLFAAGLVISGMTRPSKVVAFLDVTGRWDPSLAMVMVGAIGVYAVVYAWSKHLPSPRLAADFRLPTKTRVDGPLVVGAGLFGVGWGVSGFCPGPALTSLASGDLQPVVFCAGMTVGMILFDAVGASRDDSPLLPRPQGEGLAARGEDG